MPRLWAAIPTRAPFIRAITSASLQVICQQQGTKWCGIRGYAEVACMTCAPIVYGFTGSGGDPTLIRVALVPRSMLTGTELWKGDAGLVFWGRSPTFRGFRSKVPTSGAGSGPYL